jgi:hypothetical protein
MHGVDWGWGYAGCWVDCFGIFAVHMCWCWGWLVIVYSWIECFGLLWWRGSVIVRDVCC